MGLLQLHADAEVVHRGPCLEADGNGASGQGPDVLDTLLDQCHVAGTGHALHVQPEQVA